MMRLLSDTVPLRTTADLGEYREVRTLPWVYGRVTLEPIPADTRGRLWLVADHAVAGITAVRSGGVRVSGWQVATRVDDDGRVTSLLELSQAPEDPLSIDVVGKRDRDTGALIVHPADIVADILTASGWTIPRWYGDQLRADYPALELGGVLDDHNRTLRSVVDEILLPLGVVWSASPWIAMEEAEREPVAVLDVDDPEASARHDDIVTELRGLYAYDWAARKERRAVRAVAPQAVRQYGRVEQDWTMRWVHQPRDAERIVLRRLQRMARPQWRITGRVDLREPLPEIGETVRVDHPVVPGVPGVLMMREIDRTQARVDLEWRAPAGAVPEVRVASYGQAIDAAAAETLQVAFRDGIATFTVLNDAGAPLAGASVTLDNAITRTTDRFGRVQFTADPGPHTLTVVAAGFEPFEIGVTV